jgi:hypothetical protein
MTREAIKSGPLGQRHIRPAKPVALLPNPEAAKAATKHMKPHFQKWRPKKADASTDSGKIKKLLARIEQTENLLYTLKRELAERRQRAAADAATEPEPEGETP